MPRTKGSKNKPKVFGVTLAELQAKFQADELVMVSNQYETLFRPVVKETQKAVAETTEKDDAPEFKVTDYSSDE